MKKLAMLAGLASLPLMTGCSALAVGTGLAVASGAVGAIGWSTKLKFDERDKCHDNYNKYLTRTSKPVSLKEYCDADFSIKF